MSLTILLKTYFLEFGELANNKLCERGTIGPETAPCNIREIINVSRLFDIPYSQEAKINSKIEDKNNFTSPKRLASQPAKGIEIALATANDVIIHVD